jgi:NAD-dependent deacetylase
MRPSRLIVFSGAGLSAESGLPTFRGESGLWEGVPIRKVCHIDTWHANFEPVHDFYDARRIAESKAEPNVGHQTIMEWQKTWPGRIHILTQNIDTLLERAGCADVVHLHGEIRKLRCLDCGWVWEIEAVPYDRKGCPSCGSQKEVKPDVVFFGEAAPRYSHLHTIAQSLGPKDTVVVVGTSGAVLPADRLFGQSCAYSVLVNLEPGDQMDEWVFSERLYGPATEQLPNLATKLGQRMD